MENCESETLQNVEKKSDSVTAVIFWLIELIKPDRVILYFFKRPH